jgi:hypothetical protein
MIMVHESTPLDRDQVEGRYTQADAETAAEREVHGQYTESAGHPAPESDVVGAYVGTQHDGEPPLVRSAHLRVGNYPRSER